ncbi:hypothetical protein M409DRAFT_60414 [Zasmidium cellare ATCC 36951]|uniref:Uncharacterized protein n=1 Tax=Zasmidium cellare ATCC 36951 TaxID=1080233 RepID=A0A6A6BYZ3_ZASCE|nr:uncharacterized protein M409DRAFT_60414 [Zasmidium cellare ATCC 36951]KAF2160014.1 hypothetical protein M409DRAFT_60414 [Zasmidium cellare ATCC 36951]
MQQNPQGCVPEHSGPAKRQMPDEAAPRLLAPAGWTVLPSEKSSTKAFDSRDAVSRFSEISDEDADAVEEGSGEEEELVGWGALLEHEVFEVGVFDGPFEGGFLAGVIVVVRGLLFGSLLGWGKMLCLIKRRTCFSNCVRVNHALAKIHVFASRF